MGVEGLIEALATVDAATNQTAQLLAMRELNQQLITKIEEDETNLNQVKFQKPTKKISMISAILEKIGQYA